jgi:hypothetical protein
MFIERERIYLFVQPQELVQFESMNPNVVDMAYQSAIGRINSEIGYKYDLPAMLAKTDADRDETLLWLVTVLTCAVIVGSAINIAPLLQNEYLLAQSRLQELKAGFSTMLDAEKKDMATANARMEIVYNNKKYLG